MIYAVETLGWWRHGWGGFKLDLDKEWQECDRWHYQSHRLTLGWFTYRWRLWDKTERRRSHLPGRLAMAPWGDGSSPSGVVNIIVPEWELVVAEGVSFEMATELVRCYNEGAKTMANEMKKKKSFWDLFDDRTHRTTRYIAGCVTLVAVAWIIWG